jgi:gamma-glutamyl phosphate reductase
MKKLKQIGINAKKALTLLNNLDEKKTNKVLLDYNQLLLKNKKQILQENIKDVKSAKKNIL